MFIGLLTSIVNGSNHTKCVSLSNKKFMTQPTLVDLHPNEYSQELHYYPFAVKLDRCVGSCNTLNDLSKKACVPNKTNLSVFKLITGINESKTKKYVSCKCKCKLDGRKCNSDQKWNMRNVDPSAKNIIYMKKITFGILLHVVAKMVNI